MSTIADPDTIPAPTAGSVPVELDRVERTAEALRAHNFEVVVVDTPAEAREAVLARIPEGAEVHSGKSKTIEDLGLFAELFESGRYDGVRPKLRAMDRTTQAREMRKLGAAPDYEVGSVAAVTEDGALISASATGNNTAAYAGGAGKLILVVGAQKIVASVDEALARINEVVYPYEDARLQAEYGMPTRLTRVLIHLA